MCGGLRPPPPFVGSYYAGATADATGVAVVFLALVLRIISTCRKHVVSFGHTFSTCRKHVVGFGWSCKFAKKLTTCLLTTCLYLSDLSSKRNPKNFPWMTSKVFWNMFFDAALDSQVPFLLNFCPPGGRLRYEAYNALCVLAMFLDVLAMISGWFGNVFQMIWQCFLDDLAMFSGCFG